MSLKAIHIVFIIASMLLCVGFGMWALDEYSRRPGTVELCYVIGSGVLFVALAVYGVYFLKKLKKISYL